MLKILYYFFYYLIYSVFRGKANKKIHNPKKILIIQNARLGDMVCTTPMFRAVKERYSDCKVYVMGNKINKELLKHNSHVDKYFIFEIHKVKNLIKKIKKEKIDFACTTHCNFYGLTISYLSGIPLITVPKIKNGFCPTETRLFRILRNFVTIKDHNNYGYAPREYLRLLESIGIYTDNTKKQLNFSIKALVSVKNYFLKNNISKNDFIVGITPSAGNKVKLWSRKKFAEIADYLYENYKAKIIIIGGQRDLNEVKEMIGYLDKKTKYYNTAGKLNIDELKAIISRMKLFVSVDTGPIYIAEAFGVATIDIVGPVDERVQPPVGKIHKIVKVSDRQKGEFTIMNSHFYNKDEAQRQIDEISVGMVVNKLNKIKSI